MQRLVPGRLTRTDPRAGRRTSPADALPTGRDVVAWAREAVERGAGEILLTSMDRDGTNDGYDLALTTAVCEAVSVPVIASGGAGELDDLTDALRAGADAALCASIFHYGQSHDRRGQGPSGRRRDPRADRLRTTSDEDGRGGAMDELRTDGEVVLERMRELPGGRELLDLAAAREDVELVGGAVRDLLLGRTPRELDVVVGSDAPSFARDLATRLRIPAEEDPEGRFGIIRHERFGTALVWWDRGRIDIAGRRAESYSAPGALPDVRTGTIEEDLRRRDFTVNAIAALLGGPRMGELSTRAAGLRRPRARTAARASRAKLPG